MDLIDYQKYDYIQYRVKHLLREWKQLKPHFEAKLATTTSPTVKCIYTYSLYCLVSRLDKANADLRRIIDDVHDICKTNGLSTTFTDLFCKPNTGITLRNAANIVLNEIHTLQRKFKGNDDKLPFKALPYEFQSRLVALLPPNDVFAFKFAGKTATKHVYRRSMFSVNFIVVENSIRYEFYKSKYGADPLFNISSISYFLKLNHCYALNALCLSLGSPEMYDHAVKIVAGTYKFVELKGVFTWKQAVYFMNLNSNIKHVTLYPGIQLDEEDFNEFFEAVVQWLLNRKDVFTFYINYVELGLTFGDRFKMCVESRTSFPVKCSDVAAICKRSNNGNS